MSSIMHWSTCCRNGDVLLSFSSSKSRLVYWVILNYSHFCCSFLIYTLENLLVNSLPRTFSIKVSTKLRCRGSSSASLRYWILKILGGMVKMSSSLIFVIKYIKYFWMLYDMRLRIRNTSCLFFLNILSIYRFYNYISRAR